ncbi:MAG: hypothetical protein WKG03_00420 [Telluria sp.]
MIRFFRACRHGRVWFRRLPRYIGFSYDRCDQGGWDFYVFYLGFFKLSVHAEL